MKSFWIKTVNLLLIVGAVWAYNMTTQMRVLAVEAQTAQVQAQEMQNQLATENEAESGNYLDGIYTGEGQGFGGSIEVAVTVASGKMTAIEITSAEKEDGAYLDMARDIIDRILTAQNTDVDTVSGATFSSTGIKDAVQTAIEKAVK